MSKKLAIMYDNGDYYDPTYEIEVIDVDFSKKEMVDKYRDYAICSSSRDLANFLMECVDDFESHAEVELSIQDIKNISTCRFDTLIANYEFLQELKKKAYALTTHKNEYISNYRNFIYKDRGGYGEFRQELLPFKKVEYLVKENYQFVQLINDSLIEKFPDLINLRDKEFKIRALKAQLDNVEANILNARAQIVNNTIRLKQMEELKLKLLEDVKKLS